MGGLRPETSRGVRSRCRSCRLPASSTSCPVPAGHQRETGFRPRPSGSACLWSGEIVRNPPKKEPLPGFHYTVWRKSTGILISAPRIRSATTMGSPIVVLRMMWSGNLEEICYISGKRVPLQTASKAERFRDISPLSSTSHGFPPVAHSSCYLRRQIERR